MSDNRTVEQPDPFYCNLMTTIQKQAATRYGDGLF